MHVFPLTEGLKGSSPTAVSGDKWQSQKHFRGSNGENLDWIVEVPCKHYTTSINLKWSTFRKQTPYELLSFFKVLESDTEVYIYFVCKMENISTTGSVQQAIA